MPVDTPFDAAQFGKEVIVTAGAGAGANYLVQKYVFGTQFRPVRGVNGEVVNAAVTAGAILIGESVHRMMESTSSNVVHDIAGRGAAPALSGVAQMGVQMAIGLPSKSSESKVALYGKQALIGAASNVVGRYVATSVLDQATNFDGSGMAVN